jgi:hypothetical protein
VIRLKSVFLTGWDEAPKGVAFIGLIFPSILQSILDLVFPACFGFLCSWSGFLAPGDSFSKKPAIGPIHSG